MKKHTLFACLGLSFHFLSAQLTIIVDQVPDTPSPPDIYIAGPFNSWQPGTVDYRMQQTGEGYTLTFDPKNELLAEFKFTRGSWENVEVGAGGQSVANRMVYYSPGDTIHCDIEGWDDFITQRLKPLNPDILVREIYAPFLASDKIIRISLPPDYMDSEKSYPVLYMMDGQNLFDDATSYSGEWQVDETMEALYEDGYPTAIVVGIDHAGDLRLMEYSPFGNPTYGGGLGEVFLQWVMDSVKSTIDREFRTLPDRSNTFIAGSSMGGLISTYAVVSHAETFGGGGAFSSSYWFNTQLQDLVSDYPLNQPVHLYFLAGSMEGADQTLDTMLMYELMNEDKKAGHNLRLVIASKGAHNEEFWRTELAAFLIWLLGC